jgi:hypothetical protein
MPKITAEDYHADELADDLAERGFDHLRVRRRGPLLTIESGPKHDPVSHARLRRDTVHLWCLEMSTHSGAWEPTPYRDVMDTIVELLTSQFAWALAPQDIPIRTSGRKY